MTARPRPPKVTIRWEARTQDGLRYAILRWTEEGRRLSRSLGYVPPAEAERQRGDQEARLRLGLPQTSLPTSPTVAVVLAEYVGRILTDGVGGDRYREQERAFALILGEHLGHLLAARVTVHDLRAYIAARRQAPGRRRGTTLSVATIKHELQTLRRAWDHGFKSGLISTPFPGIPTKAMPDNRRPPRWLTEGEVAAILRAAEAWQPVAGRLLTFLAWCPARPREILALSREDCARLLDPALPREERLIRFRQTKGGEGRGWRPLAEPALEAALDQLHEEPGPWLWRARDGDRAMPYATLYDWLRKAARGPGVADVTPYDLRKFGAGRILRATGSPADVVRFTGHTDVATFLRWYAQGAAGEAEAAAASITWTPAPLRIVGADDGTP